MSCNFHTRTATGHPYRTFPNSRLLRMFCFAKRNPPPQFANWGTSFQKEVFFASQKTVLFYENGN